MHIAQFILTTAILWAFLLPQPAVSGDMLVCLGPAYEDRSEVEAYAAQIAADGDSTRLGISSAGTPGQRNFDDQQVTIQFATNSSGVKMVAFSDDGVTITIRDLTAGTAATTVLSNKGVGQALPNLGQSLHDINFTFLPQHTYEITVDYLNTYYTGEGDVDGAQLIAYGGAIASTPVVDRIIVKDSNPEELGPVLLPIGQSLTLKAIPGPVGASFPVGEPHWQIASKPPTSQLSEPASGSDTADLAFDAVGEYVIEATCGPSTVAFAISTVGVDKIIVESSSPQNEGPVELYFGTSVKLKALRTPAPVDGEWPQANPVWGVDPAEHPTGAYLNVDTAVGPVIELTGFLPENVDGPVTFQRFIVVL